MLESITLKDFATFDQNGIEITDLKAINFIYGTNGSGKTTISKLLYEPINESFKNCSLKWRNDKPVKVLVYNKDFRERNFGKGSINGVFTLGQATKEDLELIEEKTRLRKAKDEEIIKSKNSLAEINDQKNNEEGTFKETVWNQIYKKHEGEFKEAFRGALNKEGFKNKLLLEYSSNKANKLTIEDLKEQASIIWGDTPRVLKPITQVDDFQINEIESSPIWAKKILGKNDVNIAGLIQKLNINDWVNEGRNYIDGDTCPFCQAETISAEFRKQLEAYFDESFIKESQLVNEQFQEYLDNSDAILDQLNQVSLEITSLAHKNFPSDVFTANVKSMETLLNSNIEQMKVKKKELSRSIELKDSQEGLQNLITVIKDANIEVDRHNQIVNNYEKQKVILINAIWRYILDDSNTLIKLHTDRIKGFEKGIVALENKIAILEKEYKDINSQIKKLTANVTSIQPSIDRMNNILESYGFNNFRIVASKANPNQYQILREDDSLAESTLSEGEITFITFLYYLQLVKGGISEDSITENRILVIDDPISSLDSNVLFIVSSLVKEIINTVKKGEGNIKQVILLTHNIYFHKEVSFIDSRTKEIGNTFFWILRRKKGTSYLQSYGMKNTIYNSYELLWQELKNKQSNSSITVQNTMRRIIENYFKILGKYGDDQLIQKFKTSEEQQLCRSLISWINDGSHSIPDDIFIELQDDATEKYFEVFKNIFIHTNHEEHYKMMMGEPELAN